MRESNFAFPAQNRACVCITSQLYDRRALDTDAPLPLFNSLTHLTYLTSTSPRIREIMTMDGGLERLVRIIHDFCICPPPPENPTLFYGLQPPSSHLPKPVPTLIPKTYDRNAQLRFSLALQCVVNIGVRGSEPIRSRVVQAGTLDVVGCILEAWLAGKGFAVGPNVSANGMPRETREQRMARRQAQAEMRSREHTAELERALQRQVALEYAVRLERTATSEEIAQDDMMDVTSPTQAEDTDTPTDTSTAVTPGGARGRSGTIVGHSATLHVTSNTHRRSRASGPSTSTSAGNSRPETETEDDGDVDMDREVDPPSTSGSPSPERRDSSADTGTVRAVPVHSRRPVIVSDTPPATATGASLDMNTDAHIIINEEGGAVEGVGVDDGIVSLEQNNDLAMGAPPGAPGAIDTPAARAVADAHGTAGERTPRARPANLPLMIPIAAPSGPTTTTLRVTGPGEPVRTVPPNAPRLHASRGTITPVTVGGAGTAGAATQHVYHHPREDSGPYRDEDVLLSLQLLAYLSKYPYVRQAFYKPRPTFHPASLSYPAGDGRYLQAVPSPSGSRLGTTNPSSSNTASGSSSSVQTPVKEPNSFLKAFASATGRGKEKEKAPANAALSGSASPTSAQPPRMTNVFSLVERFTFRHSSSELDSSNPPPSLPPEIQYWAGVIMRNACRKDDSRGGIRQCANMLCGKWETFPREFAKCRRCRKAKYCGKECQSTAWSEGHRFWCSAKDPEEDGEHHHGQRGEGSSRSVATASAGTVTGRAERRAERERERHARAVAAEARLAEHLGVRSPAATTANAMRPVVAAIGINPNTTLATLNAQQPTPRARLLQGAGLWATPDRLTMRLARQDEPLSRTGRLELALVPPPAAMDAEALREARRHLMHLVEGEHETGRGEGPSTTFIGQREEDSPVDDPMIFD